jgi:hypothetical protein
MSFHYVRPDEAFTYGSVSGTVDATYDANWLVNGSPLAPAVGASGLTLTVTAPAARTVSLLAAVNSNVTGTIAISGGVTGTIPAAAAAPDGAFLNPWVAITPVSASSLVMTVGQSPSIVGELVAGTMRTLERQLLVDPEFDPSEPLPWLGEASSLPPYDPGVVARTLVGETIVTQAGLEEIHAWYRSTRRGSRPTLIVPVDTVQDAWYVTFRYTFAPHMHGKTGVLPGMIRVRFAFTEVPRVRWP